MSYIVYHPGTGTFLDCNESFLMHTDDLPPDFDDWEEFAQNSTEFLVPMNVIIIKSNSWDMYHEN